MDNDEKIIKWIKEMEEKGMSRDKIARAEFVSKRSDGTFITYKLSKSGKTKYDVKIHIGALNLDEM